MSESRRTWRQNVAQYRTDTLDALRNADMGMTNLCSLIAVGDPRYSEVNEIQQLIEELHKRVLRINLPLT